MDISDDERERLGILWMTEAANSKPSIPSWVSLVVELRKAAWTYRKVRDQGPQARRRLLVEIVAGLTDFINREPAFNDADLRQGLMPLIEALHDLENNIQPDLFKAQRTGKRGQPPLSAARNKLKGSAARALFELLDANPDVDAEQTKLAANKVARAIKAGQCIGYEKCSSDTVVNWFTDLRRGPDLDGKRSIALNRFDHPLPPEAGTTSASRAEFILSSLRIGKGYK